MSAAHDKPDNPVGTEEFCVDKLQSLSNNIRLKVVRALMNGQASVSQLLESIPIEQNLMSHHLKILRENGIVNAHREGKSVHYSLCEDVRLRSKDAIDLGCCHLSF